MKQAKLLTLLTPTNPSQPSSQGNDRDICLLLLLCVYHVCIAQKLFLYRVCIPKLFLCISRYADTHSPEVWSGPVRCCHQRPAGGGGGACARVRPAPGPARCLVALQGSFQRVVAWDKGVQAAAETGRLQRRPSEDGGRESPLPWSTDAPLVGDVSLVPLLSSCPSTSPLTRRAVGV